LSGRFLLSTAVVLVLSTGFAGRSAASDCVSASEHGQAAREKGRLREARKHFVSCAADACPKPLRLDCARWLDEVDASLPTVVFGAKDARGADVFDMTVVVDGQAMSGHEQGRAVPLDPGPHVVRFERAGTRAVETRVLLRTGERNRPILVTFADSPNAGAGDKDKKPSGDKPDGAVSQESGGISPAAIVFGGIGIVALGSFGYFALAGTNEKNRLRTTCAPACTDEDVSTLRTQYIAADISLGVGIVALGVAAFFLIKDTLIKDTRASASQRLARTIWK
jgi:hypothetical protein